MKKPSASSHLIPKLLCSGFLGVLFYYMTQSLSGMFIIAVTVYLLCLYLMRFVKQVGPVEKVNQYTVAAVATLSLVLLCISNEFASLFAIAFSALMFSLLVMGDTVAGVVSKYMEAVIAKSKAKKPEPSRTA